MRFGLRGRVGLEKVVSKTGFYRHFPVLLWLFIFPFPFTFLPLYVRRKLVVKPHLERIDRVARAVHLAHGRVRTGGGVRRVGRDARRVRRRGRRAAEHGGGLLGKGRLHLVGAALSGRNLEASALDNDGAAHLVGGKRRSSALKNGN